MHTVRRNPDIAHFVHNNQVYGLTKGQASPTSEPGMVTETQRAGVFNPPLNPLALALVLGAGFVARCYSGETEHLQETMQKAIEFPGYALVDILHPCVSFNKLNTYSWYKERVYKLENHDTTDWQAALGGAMEWGDKIPLGVFYAVPRTTFEESLSTLKGAPLATRPFDPSTLTHIQDAYT